MPDDLIVKAGNRLLSVQARPLIMGVLNVTPDSFYDGGRFEDVPAAVDRARIMVEEGADIIDIGAESSRPGASPVSEDEEMRRLIPVVKAVHGAVDLPISVDTTKARVASRAIEAGASIVNDISALTLDQDMARIVAESGAGVVLMHMQGRPQTMQRAPHYHDVVGEVYAFLAERIGAAEAAGISRMQIVLDPGIGFGKLQDHNLALLAHAKMFADLRRPLLVGVSRKAFTGHVLGQPIQDRLFGTAAAVAVAVLHGAGIIRVHDVGPMRDVITMTRAIAGATDDHQQVRHA
jgi:dihydropteroate synthase